MFKKLKERLYAKVTAPRLSDGSLDPNACHLYTGGALDKDGYGRFWDGQRTRPAHQVAYELARGPVPDGLVVRHSSGCSRSCVNPRHLHTGTVAENMEDREHDGNNPRGQRNGRSRLTEQQVREIRAAVDRGAVQAEVARKYKVHSTTVRDIVRGKLWSHLP